MQSGKPSQTAMVSAIGRGRHRELRARPWVLDDPYARVFVGSLWDVLEAAMAKRFTSAMVAQIEGYVIMRSRFTEERLEQGGFAQYVILGAGFDTFAWRRPDLVSKLRVFEMDHPSTQDWKRARAELVGLPGPQGHVYIPLNLEGGTPEAGLTSAGFDWSKPTLISWLGVTSYLRVPAIEATLRALAACAPGSEIVFTYPPPLDLIDPESRALEEIIMDRVGDVGEPHITTFTPEAIEALVARCGLTLVAHPTTEDLYKAYFAGRSDGLRSHGIDRLIVARVAG